MSTYARIKQTVTTRQAAERYGLSVNRSGMARCPFHEDHNPSMKVDDRFYCFGCHQGGDVIDFRALVTKQSRSDAARQLAQTFCVPESKAAASRRESILSMQKARENRLRMRDIANALAELYRAQNANMSRYAPTREEADKPWPEAFETACKLLPVIDCALTIADER